MQLRPYQLEAEQKIYQAWNTGAKNVGIVLPTGAGKTVLLSKIVSTFNNYSILIAHRMELVSQLSIALATWGIKHNIVAQKNTIKNIINLHLYMFNKSFYDPQAIFFVAGIDTLLRLNFNTVNWCKKIKLVIQDEAHHVLKKNKWGKAAALFPNAIGLYPTATPLRADGFGLGRNNDGILDTLIIGAKMRDLIKLGYLSDYRIISVPNNLDLSEVKITSTGDFSPPKLRNAVHKSQITGNIVSHYLRFAKGKLGITFAVDIKAATEITIEFKNAGIPAEMVTSKTPDLLRAQIMRRFKNKEILQLINVDLLGEGVDIPAVEVISLARPTASFVVFAQQFGRALRPLQGKDKALIIDHVGNTIRHGLPDDIRRQWSLNRAEKRNRSTALGVIPIRTCLNPLCFAVYERIKKECPLCGKAPEIRDRKSPEHVDGDLIELDENMLRMMRGEVDRVDGNPQIPINLPAHAQVSLIDKWNKRQEAQKNLRETIACWCGYRRVEGLTDSEMYRTFYFVFGIDMLTAQTLNTKEAQLLQVKINMEITA